MSKINQEYYFVNHEKDETHPSEVSTHDFFFEEEKTFDRIPNIRDVKYSRSQISNSRAKLVVLKDKPNFQDKNSLSNRPRWRIGKDNQLEETIGSLFSSFVLKDSFADQVKEERLNKIKNNNENKGYNLFLQETSNFPLFPIFKSNKFTYSYDHPEIKDGIEPNFHPHNSISIVSEESESLASPNTEMTESVSNQLQQILGKTSTIIKKERKNPKKRKRNEEQSSSIVFQPQKKIRKASVKSKKKTGTKKHTKDGKVKGKTHDPKDIALLQDWFIQNILVPYPNRTNLLHLSQSTKNRMEQKQIAFWFSNTRKRKWKKEKTFIITNSKNPNDPIQQKKLNDRKSVIKKSFQLRIYNALLENKSSLIFMNTKKKYERKKKK